MSRHLAWLGLGLALSLPTSGLAAQGSVSTLRLSLDDALSKAVPESEALALARVVERRARGDLKRAGAERYPQITASLTYSRLLQSQFGSFGDNIPQDSISAPPICDRFVPDPLQPIDVRLGSLEAAVSCASTASPFALFGDLPFGRKNTYTFGLGLSQTLFAGGRISAQSRAAKANRRTTELGVSAAQAALVLEIVQAYYDAALSDRLLVIAEATLDQTDSTLRQTTVARDAGTAPEFDYLRAQVARDNQRPAVIQRRAERRFAYLRLTQLLGIPENQSLELTTPLSDRPVDGMASLPTPSTPDAANVRDRLVVQQANQAVLAQENLLRAAQASAYPSVVVTSQFGQIAYPKSGVPAPKDFLTNWTVGIGVQVPLFTGGRLKGDRMVAEANVQEAQLRYRQTVKLAQLDSRDAQDQLLAAEARWDASAGTAEQASRAYAIAQVRFQEGISTQTELLDARIALQQSEWNRARAARDLQVARVRIALLERLPLTGVVPEAPVGVPIATPAAAPTQTLQASQTGIGFP